VTAVGLDLEVGASRTVDVTDSPADVLAVAALAAEAFRPADAARLLGVTGADHGDGADGVRALDGMTTRLRPAAGGLLLHQDVRVLGPDGAARQRIGLRWSLPGDLPAPSARQLAVGDVGSVEWGQRLAERLAADPEFSSSVATFDGTVGLVSGEEAVRFRIYRGRIVETAKKALDGPTFDVTAEERTWVELLLGEHDDYVRFAARGRFKILGSGFQYLRMTRTVRLAVSAARAMAKEDSGADER
jgi:hypothetical protein